MNYLKMFGLAAVAAAALMVIGPGTVTATVLCKNNASTEKCSEPYPVGTEGTATLAAETTLVLEASGGTVLDTCSESTVKSTLANAGSATTTVKSGVSTITWGNCTRTTTTLNPGGAEAHWIPGTNDATFTTIEGTEITINTIFGTCVYGTGAALDMGIAKGGKPGSLTISTSVPKISGNFACPATGVLTGKYVATSPTAAWVTKE